MNYNSDFQESFYHRNHRLVQAPLQNWSRSGTIFVIQWSHFCVSANKKARYNAIENRLSWLQKVTSGIDPKPNRKTLCGEERWTCQRRCQSSFDFELILIKCCITFPFYINTQHQMLKCLCSIKYCTINVQLFNVKLNFDTRSVKQS